MLTAPIFTYCYLYPISPGRVFLVPSCVCHTTKSSTGISTNALDAPLIRPPQPKPVVCSPLVQIPQPHVITSSNARLISYDGTLGAISSPMHSLYPADSAVLYISGADCDNCLYVPNDGTSLTMGTPYYVRVTAYNAQGASAVGSGSSDASLVAAVTPNQVMGHHIRAQNHLWHRLSVLCSGKRECTVGVRSSPH